ncbi:MAG TPA: transporter [Candidatus Binataceae bacterium]
MSGKRRGDPRSKFYGALIGLLLLCGAAGVVGAGGCPTTADPIATDRPDVTNSSLVVPYGSFQVENGVDWTSRLGLNALDGTNTRLRLGIARCAEILLDTPNFFYALNQDAPSGFSDVVASFKYQFDQLPDRLNLSATAGLAFPIGARRVAEGGYAPYIQFPWSLELSGSWSVEGMFTSTWLTDQASSNPTLESTFSVEREFGPSADMFVEYVGDYPHHLQPSQVIDAGGTWRITPKQQLDFHVGAGLNAASVGQFFGLGYSFRLDRLFGGKP